MSSLIATVVDRPGRAIGALIEPRPVYAPRQRWELPALLALLIVAAIVRFWGVGSFSLHKPDEDTTALPAVHILVDGTPRFPSGMFYARAIAQSYLIAGSVKVFGQTEWALRLPSVLTGILVVLLVYFLGRRFLEPAWNMAFVGVVALLPGMIADSQWPTKVQQGRLPDILRCTECNQGCFGRIKKGEPVVCEQWSTDELRPFMT